MTPSSLPWQPLYTITRSGLPEVTVHGILSVWEPGENAGDGGKVLIRTGDIDAPLWTRSLLKPWQLLVILKKLEINHPDLGNEHLAMMMASQQGDDMQIAVLNELLARSGMPATAMKCPASLPMGLRRTSDNQRPSPLFHPCSGKHLGYLLSGYKSETYTQPDQAPYVALQKLLKELLGKNALEETTDGCGMPNYALSATEMARLYWMLAQDIDVVEWREYWPRLRDAMLEYPYLMGGKGRLDSRLMDQKIAKEDVLLLAKEGAEGLLGVCVVPCDLYPQGLGILLKLAHGYDTGHLEVIITEVLVQLKLKDPKISAANRHLKTEFCFSAG